MEAPKYEGQLLGRHEIGAVVKSYQAERIEASLPVERDFDFRAA